MTTVLTAKKTTADEGTRAGLRWLCQTDLYYLVTVVLNADNPASKISPVLHTALCDFIQTTPYRTNLYMMSRGYLKTAFITVGRNIQRLCINPQTRILIGSNKADNAAAMLNEIKGHLASPLMLWLFPDILYRDPTREAERWTTEAITVKRPRRTREATIEIIGESGETTSKHFDQIGRAHV